MVFNSLKQTLSLILSLNMVDEAGDKRDSTLSNVIHYWQVFHKLLEFAKTFKLVPENSRNSQPIKMV